MQIAKNPVMERTIRLAEEACKTLQASGKQELSDQLSTLIEAAKAERFVIGVVGSAKRGKSTLINGLLGRTDDILAPVGKFPVTSAVSIFGHSTAPSIKVYFKDDIKGVGREISETEIRLYACDEYNPNNEKNVRSIEAVGPFPGLEPGVYVVDTPGSDNALEKAHGEILLQFLPVADAVIFLVTAEEPLTGAEQNLLRSIKGNDIRKIYFAINKVDLVRSGDIDPEELAEGIEHNRKILANVGFPETTTHVFQISAKDYFEKRSDPGTERLVEAIRDTIVKERISIMLERLEERTRTILTRAEEELRVELEAAKLTEEDLSKERKLIVKTRDDLRRNRSHRERNFTRQWEDSFDGLETGLQKIRKELANEYGNLIDRTSELKVAALAQTIHSDVALSFSERLKTKVIECEARLNEAQQELAGAIQTSVLRIAPDIAPGATPRKDLMNSLKVGGAAIPALVTGTVSAALPGMIGSMIASTAPTIAAASWNPLTWLPALLTAGGSTVVTGTGLAVTTALSAMAMPVAVGAFGYAAYRAYSTWKAIKSQEKNTLKSSVYHMVDDGCEQVLEQMRKYRKGREKILSSFEEMIETGLNDADKRLVDLIRNRPSPQKVQKLEEGVLRTGRQLKFLSEPEAGGDGSANAHRNRPLIDDLSAK